MRALVLSAGTALSATRLHEVTDALRSAAGGTVDIDLFTWRTTENRIGVRSATVLGPVKVYVPPPEHAPRPVAPSRPARAAGKPAGRGDEPEDLTSDDADTGSSAVEESQEPAAQLTVRRAAGIVRWGLKRRIVRVRRSKQYQAVRRLVRGGVARQFSARARRDPAVLAAARNSQVVLALDSGAIAAAWWIAKKVPGPPVVFGLPSAERELRILSSPEPVGTHH